ncbi:MAG TPA: ABC transporter permease [Streptosporangiaceae bacterium]|jgi:peptide/nickel transport system permease protein|nr:ABC transporter permease [Streptosporangiaceae bacterium]
MTAAIQATAEPETPAAQDQSRPRRGRHPLLRYALRRVAAAVVILLVLSVLVFLACSVLPGNAASAILGKQASGVALAHLEREMGLNRPIAYQYWTWLTGLVHGNLGNSAAGYAAGGQISVWSQISGKLANSAILATAAFVPIVAVSLMLGVGAALRAGRWVDHLISVTTLVPAALPEFVLGALLVGLFFGSLHLLPPVSLIPPGGSPLDTPSLLVLPVLTLVGVCVGPAARMIRAGMLDALEADCVAVARLNGIAERRVVIRYALRNALAPSVQVVAMIAQYLIGGLLIVEYMFGYPGIGQQLVNAISIHDNLEVQSVSMLLAAIYVGINIVADLVVMTLVPKLRTGGA